MGLPEDFIFCDCAGFRTLDSVVRVREVFGQARANLMVDLFLIRPPA